MNRIFRAEWSEEDGEWVGTCDEYPSLSWLAPTEAEALTNIMFLVLEAEADLASEFEAWEPTDAERAGGETPAARKIRESIMRGLEQAARGETVRRDDLFDDGSAT